MKQTIYNKTTGIDYTPRFILNYAFLCKDSLIYCGFQTFLVEQSERQGSGID